MKSLEEQIGGKCIYFTGMINKWCRKGVLYEDVKIKTHRPYQVPCFSDILFGGGECPHVKFPSKEYVDNEVKKIKDIGIETMGTYDMVQAHYDKTKQPIGVLECLKCKGELHYTVSSVNGHIWAKCSSCGMGWME